MASTTTPQDNPHRGLPVLGRVRIVDSGADFKLRIVNANARLDIHPINGGPKLDALVAKAGASRKINPKDLSRWGYTDWEFVDSGEDFTVEFVNSGEYCTIKFVFDTTGALSDWQVTQAESLLVEPDVVQTPIEALISPRIPYKVRILDADADFKIRIVDAKASANIHPVSSSLKFDASMAKAGATRLTNISDVTPMGFQEWEFVDQGEDFTVQFVDKDEHFTIKPVFNATGALSEWRGRKMAEYGDYFADIKAARIAARSSYSSSSSSSSSSYSSSSSSNRIVDCKCKGIPLHGRVRVVDHSNADFRVRVVNSAPADLYVLSVGYPSPRCGQWQFVKAAGLEDFTVQYVEAAGLEDFTIQFVSAAGLEGVR